MAAAVVAEGDADERRLRSWCGERLADFKIPKRVYFIRSIPRTPTGKVQRSRLAALLAEA